MAKNWTAVAEAITTRLAELGMTQNDLSTRSGVSVATVRQLQRNYEAKRRSPRTLSALSEALRWPADHLARVRDGAVAADDLHATDASDSTVATIIDKLAEYDQRLAQVEHRLDQVERAGR